MNTTIHYTSHADKAHKWLTCTLPSMIAAALRAAKAPPAFALRAWLARFGLPAEKAGAGVPQQRLATLHQAARQGLYVAEFGPKDEVREVATPLVAGDKVTLIDGGDCEDWAAVLAAVAMLWGAPVRIVSSGTPEDHFLHAYAEIGGDLGRFFTLDPKGSQAGAAFDFRSERNPVRRWWTWRVDRHSLVIDEVQP